MWLLYVVAAVVAVTSSAQSSAIHRTKRTVDFISGTCDSTQTKIYTKTIKTTEFTKCPITTLISRYYRPFLDECEHWMGSRPDHVASSYVYYCLEDPTTGGVTIKATVCCKGTLQPNVCVQCTSTDPDQCDYSRNAVVHCADGEICQTELTCDSGNLQATIRKSCVRRCNGTDSCATTPYLEYGQKCTDCCNGAFCNKGGRSLTCYRHCSCTYMVAGNYHCTTDGRCVCNAGCTGTRCETCTATCNPNPCKNFGLCQSNGGSVSCCCKPGYHGKYCEHRLPSCSRSFCSNHGECYDKGSEKQCVCDPGYNGKTCQKIPEAFNCPSSKNIYFSNPVPLVSQCSAVLQTPLSMTSELSACKYYMRSQYGSREIFREGRNGHVAQLTDVGYNLCDEGDCGYAHYQTKTCCPSCFSNPCQNGGYCLQTEQNGESEDFVCRCKFGFTGKYCEKRVQTCFAFGEPHYLTFDGKFITHQGACRYILTMHSSLTSGLAPFAVYLKNEYRGSRRDVSYPSYVETDVSGYRVRIGRNNVVQVKPTSGTFKEVSLNAFYPEFSIKTVGRFVRLETTFGLVVQYDGYNMLFVQIPDTYANALSGICNNMDGDESNDLRDCTGVVRSDDESGHTTYGDSCLDPDYTSNPGSCRTAVPPSCPTESYAGNNWCGHIVNKNGPLAACITAQTAYDFLACKYDVCRDNSSKCQAIESFVEKCYQSGGSPDSKWRSLTGCPMNCPKNAHYEFSGSACQATCENPRAHLACEFDDTEICQCDGGMLLRDGECVPREKCGCKDSDNVRHEVNDVWGVDMSTCQQKKCVLCTNPNCTTPGKVIEETATPVNGGWGEWSSWSVCRSSADAQKRTRQCDNPQPQCGGSTCTGNDVDSKACPTNPPTTTTTQTTTQAPTLPPQTPTPPPCAKNFDYAKACHECDLTRNPNMYIQNPCGCETYFQCSVDAFGAYHVTERPCSYCTCWNQTILTCDHDVHKRNKNSHLCKDTIIREHVTDYGGICTVRGDSSGYTRRLQAIPGDNKHYIDKDAGDITMPCAPGTVFDSHHCRCVRGVNNLNQREFMCLDFNDKNNPYTTTTGVWVSPSPSGLYPGQPGIRGYGLRFDGGNLEVPAFNNKEIHQMTISLWYKRDRPSYGGSQALIANDDCTHAQTPSIQILSKSGSGVEGGVRTQFSDILDDLFSYVADDSSWHHVAMTFDAAVKRAALYLDGTRMTSRSANGPIMGAHCPLLIGSMYGRNYFHGVMDQICFYDNAFSDAEVRQLFVERR